MPYSINATGKAFLCYESQFKFFSASERGGHRGHGERVTWFVLHGHDLHGSKQVGGHDGWHGERRQLNDSVFELKTCTVMCLQFDCAH